MALLKKEESKLISFNEIMSSVIECCSETKFEKLDDRELFTDGFCVPMGGF